MYTGTVVVVILKLTFNDNDFTQYIEDFLQRSHNDFRVIVMQYARDRYDNDIEFSLKMRDVLDLIENVKIKPTPSNKDDLANILKRALLYWISTNERTKDAYDYLKDNIEISYVKAVKSKWENGEVVYWFIDYNKYITM